ncbi:MAG TPA: polyphosphate polymerase domain-containing protein [Gaiellaceae bacterium]|nr:polyphosphate polymerase domain-containing protein [Gaiellaceae bacterium]
MSLACPEDGAGPGSNPAAGGASVRRALALGKLAPIALPALVDRAGLATRVERKYLVSATDAARLCGLLPPEARVLEIGGSRAFRYASAYFDTPARDIYLATAYRRGRRFKVRIRQYLDSELAYVEVKARRGRFTTKDRVPSGGADSLTAAAAAHLAGYLRAARVFDLDVAALAPALRTRYRRTTVYLPESGSRVTFDTELSFSTAACDRRGRTIELPELVVVETKTAGPPSSLDRLLWSLGIRPVKFSKFGTGLAALHPELPHTRWVRSMRNELAGSVRSAVLRVGPPPSGRMSPSAPARA